MGYCNNSGYNTNKTGWWYTYPSEKSWSSSVEIIISNIWKNIWKYIVTGKDDIPYMKCKKKGRMSFHGSKPPGCYGRSSR